MSFAYNFVIIHSRDTLRAEPKMKTVEHRHKRNPSSWWQCWNVTTIQRTAVKLLLEGVCFLVVKPILGLQMLTVQSILTKRMTTYSRMPHSLQVTLRLSATSTATHKVTAFGIITSRSLAKTSQQHTMMCVCMMYVASPLHTMINRIAYYLHFGTLCAFYSQPVLSEISLLWNLTPSQKLRNHLKWFLFPLKYLSF